MNRLHLLDLADFENIYLLHQYDLISFEELKRRHAGQRCNVVSGGLINTEPLRHRVCDALQSEDGASS